MFIHFSQLQLYNRSNKNQSKIELQLLPKLVRIWDFLWQGRVVGLMVLFFVVCLFVCFCLCVFVCVFYTRKLQSAAAPAQIIHSFTFPHPSRGLIFVFCIPPTEVLHFFLFFCIPPPPTEGSHTNRTDSEGFCSIERSQGALDICFFLMQLPFIPLWYILHGKA